MNNEPPNEACPDMTPELEYEREVATLTALTPDLTAALGGRGDLAAQIVDDIEQRLSANVP